MSKNHTSPTEEEKENLLKFFKNGDYKKTQIIAETHTNNYPNDPLGWQILSAVSAMIGKLEKSLIASQKLINLAPDQPSSHINLGGSYHALGNLEESEKSYRRAISLDSRNLSANLNLAIILIKLKNLKESEELLKKVIDIDENNFNAYFYLGKIYNSLQKNDKALISYRKALSINPNHADTYANLGSTLILNSQFDEAEKNCKKAILLDPNQALAYYNLGNIYKNTNELEKAKKNYERTLKINPKNFLALCNLGNIFQETAQYIEAIKYYKKAIEIKPDFAEAFNNIGNSYRKIGKMKDAELNYRNALKYKENFPAAYSNLLFLQSYILVDPDLHRNEARNFAKISRKDIKKPFSDWIYEQKPDVLRIGFVSGDFFNHPVGFFLDSFLSELKNLNVELFAYSNNYYEDNFTNRLKKNILNWRKIYNMSDKEASELIHKDNLNILIDLSGHTAKNRLPIFIYKPSPIQLTWLGYWATTGISEIDFFLGDPFVTPENEKQHFEEKIFNLPETFACFSEPNFDIKVKNLPALSNGNITFGCFNDIGKMTDEVVKARAEILNSVKNSKLFLKNKQLNTSSVRDIVLDRFSSHNISSDRIILEGSSPREKYLETYNKIDFALSPFPYGGVTTTVEGLWMGVPALTMKGDRYISHVGESIAVNVGLSDWVAKDVNDYINKAIKFSSKIDELSKLRNNLRNQVLLSPLYNAKRFAISFEKALWKIWENKN